MQVMEHFRDVYLERQNAAGNPTPAIPKMKNLNLLKDKEGLHQHILAAALNRAPV